MRDLARHGLLIACLIAAAVVCVFLALTPTAPADDRIVGTYHGHAVTPAPYIHPDYAGATTDA